LPAPTASVRFNELLERCLKPIMSIEEGGPMP
jgi:hypothetical protein